MNLSELWIGDMLRIKSTGKIGKFEGVENGQARMNVQEEIVLTDADDLKIVDEKKLAASLNAHQDDFKERTRIDKLNFGISYNSDPYSLDLHIDVLNPSLNSNRPERIFDFQMKAFDSYLRRSIKEKKSSIKIIHGKGTGVLKAEIESILKYHPQVLQSFSVNDGGAIEVILTV